MFDDVVFGETIKVDSSPIPAEKDSREGQEIGQRFSEMIHALHCLDENVDCEVSAVTIASIR